MNPNVRRWNILVHRYLGYYFFGLTSIYAISGFAVNHTADWNPSYIIEKKSVTISPLKDKEEISEAEVNDIFNKLDIHKPYNKENIFYPGDDAIQMVLSEGEKLTIDTSVNKVEYEETKKRPVLNAFNFLHLNNPKKLWTFYADIYAISLLIIAVTGMFMKKGKEGAIGKGGIIAIVGIIIPIVALFLYY